jgi:hypothetical protein
MGLFGLFGKKNKLDLSMVENQILSDGDAVLLTDKDFVPLRLMYITDDVMDGESLKIGDILEKYGYQDLDIGKFDGTLITGLVKGRYLFAENIFDFKEINNLD